ncbi:HDIG domain-containing protein [Anaerocolumna sp. AGMB13025]|uniref:HDIG domain-containing metalloprotein n=1 Tax=Anaerocolumna sp. AGMB13025 TaxID=3039116 RepID=UPI00241DB017|nr:HDIG domain-containing metalloprotein [Anaerocolumna sp. AGMB13025]WFR59976.1 HDIG domain-containing protein [Anaerocolumna sp. AGMB13025]
MKHLSTAKGSKPFAYMCGIVGIVSVFIILFFGTVNGAALITIIKLSVLSVVLISIIAFYILSQGEKIKELPNFYVIFTITYLVSICLIMFTKGSTELTLWMAGGLLTAMAFHMYLGYLVTFNLILLAGFAGGFQLEFIIYLLILGTLYCLLSGYMIKLATLVYSTVIILSLQLILIFIIHNFILKNALYITALYSLVSSLAVIGLSFLAYSLYKKKVFSSLDHEEQSTESIGIVNREDIKAVDRDGLNYQNSDLSYNLDEILDINFPLLLRLREYSTKVYKHSLLISDLSQRAAKAAGADELKAKAGGLYHEIGRITNKEYVEEGIKLAEDYLLPDFIKDIIRQHNIKYDKPKSPEAAIVMIAISVIATKEYLEKTEVKSSGDSQEETLVPIDKIVDNVFQMRLRRGSLDESGLTLKQYNDLKEFFLSM